MKVLWWRNKRSAIAVPTPAPGKIVRTLVVEQDPDEGVIVGGTGPDVFDFTVQGRLISTTWKEVR